MKKFDLPLLADVLFYGVAAWFLTLGVVRYFRAPLWVSLLTASLLSLAVSGAVFLILYTRHRRVAVTKSARERKEKLLLHLALERPERVTALLASALTADGRQAQCTDAGLTVDGMRAVPMFTMQPLSADAVALLLREYGEEPFTLWCNALTPEAARLLASFGRKGVEQDEVFDLFERTEATPERLICGEIPRPKFRAKLKRTFSKKNARPFFVSGIFLLLFSLFALYPVYYLISGCVLLIAAICTRLVGFG